ncbi:MAG: radical SAM family heme chaperone HemW [Cytophagaceae bacterium]|nr:radical SAM family heme chaperone HemW [Cytophagaceae bacterium]
MQGLYIHIPFCSVACHYCDFHFSTNLRTREEMVDMIVREIELRKDYLKNKKLDTIYFGGGTPSLLHASDIDKILNQANKIFTLSPETEVTLEANPDDLTKEKVIELKSLSVNRLSIGIQSFNDRVLKYINRAHSSIQAKNSINFAKDAGLDISIDLIYGIPESSNEIWQEDISTVLSFDVPHISSYGLTIEPKTVFGKWLEKKQMKPVDEETAAQQFEMLMSIMEANAYEHYEISNFCKRGKEAKHNSSYWLGGLYLGVGPSAHSYNGSSRQFNAYNNSEYVNALKKNELPYTKELLSKKDIINEKILTGLRTKWGLNIQKLKDEFGFDFGVMDKTVDQYLNDGYLDMVSGIIILTKKGKMIADKITFDLFLTEDI